MSFQSTQFLSSKPLRFNLTDLWFQQESKFISLQIFRSNPQIFNKISNFSTKKLECHHPSSLPDLQTELLVLPLKLGHHNSKSTYQVRALTVYQKFRTPPINKYLNHFQSNIWWSPATQPPATQPPATQHQLPAPATSINLTHYQL